MARKVTDRKGQTHEVSVMSCIIGGLFSLGILVGLFCLYWTIVALKNGHVFWGITFAILALVAGGYGAVSLKTLIADIKTLRAKPDESAILPNVINSSRPSAPKPHMQVVASGGRSYDYSRVGLYRPEDAVGPMPPLGAELEFEAEPDNPYDDQAIKAVYNGETVGYMNRTQLREMIRDWLDNDYTYTAEVTRADSRLEFDIHFERG